jgi:hypothetical protein
MARTSQPFVAANPDQLLLLAQVAETWRCRPSSLLEGTTREFQIDLAAAVALWNWREKVASSQQPVPGD